MSVYVDVCMCMSVCIYVGMYSSMCISWVHAVSVGWVSVVGRVSMCVSVCVYVYGVVSVCLRQCMCTRFVIVWYRVVSICCCSMGICEFVDFYVGQCR